MKLRRLIVCAALCALLFPAPASADAAPYRGYEYNYYGVSKAAPNIYLPEDVLLGDGTLSTPGDCFAAPDGLLYVADTGNNRIVALNDAYRIVRIIDHAVLDGETLNFSSPQGVYVRGNTLYVCDTGNARVLALDESLTVLAVYDEIDDSMTTTAFKYAPICVAVDSAGVVYILSQSNYEGILMFSPEGRFLGFFGADRVDVTAALLIERAWRMMMSDEQRQKTARIIPTPYSAVFIDGEDFLFASIDREKAASTTGEIRRLNARGNNIYSNVKYGDLEGAYVQGTYIDTAFDDIIVHEGMVYALDTARCRVFCYDDEGNAIGAFGMSGRQTGAFRAPCAVAAYGGYIVVLDRTTGAFTRFLPTAYGAALMAGARLYNNGLYNEAAVEYRRALELNAAGESVYARLGLALERMGDAESALRYYRLGQDRELYNTAFKTFRRQWLRERFGWVAAAALLMIALPVAFGFIRKRRPVKTKKRLSQIRLAFSTMLHPVNGYEEIKYGHAGSAYIGGAILFLYFIARVVSQQYAAFLFNTTDSEALKPGFIFCATVVPVLVFVTVNWAICTLNGGEGTFRQIFVTAAYAMLPLTLYEILYTVVSYALTREEMIFLQMLGAALTAYTGVMIYQSVRITHQFTGKKTLVTLFLCVLGIAAVALVAVVLYSLFQQMAVFFTTIYNELMIRIG